MQVYNNDIVPVLSMVVYYRNTAAENNSNISFLKILELKDNDLPLKHGLLLHTGHISYSIN